MIIIFFKRAIRDIVSNSFLNIIAFITLTLSILIVSTFVLFAVNVNDSIKSCIKDIKILIYLKSSPNNSQPPYIKQKLLDIDGVEEVTFISKEEALLNMKKQMKQQSFLFDNLIENPLPDSFEIRFKQLPEIENKIEQIVKKIKSFAFVDEVEYGQQWVGKFTYIFNMFKVLVIGIGILFFLAAIFIMSNTIRLILYTKREEVEIMRLVGATEYFIKAPFYIQGIILGTSAGFIGILLLFIIFMSVSSNFDYKFYSDLLQIKFLPAKILFVIILSSMMVGWFGCYISFKQFLTK